MAEALLSEVVTLLKRGVTPAYTDDSSGVVVLNQKCVRDNSVLLHPARRTDPDLKRIPHEKYLVHLDILVNSTGEGTLGRVAQLRHPPTEPVTVDSHVTIVRADPARVLPEFLGIVLFAKQDEIEDMAEGSTGQTELSAAALGSLAVTIPSDNEQRRLAELFHSLELTVENGLQRADAARRLRDTLIPDLIGSL